MAEDEGTPTPQPGKIKPWTLREFGGKTVWDWMDLLIVPIVLSLITVGFTVVQEIRQGELAEQRAQDEAVQAYLGQMNTLLLEHNLRNSKEDSGVRTLARARTLTLLERLDPSRKTAVMQFLVEAELVQQPFVCGPMGCGVDPSDPIIRPIIKLDQADLSEADLSHAALEGADLSEADLSKADLSHALMGELLLGSVDETVKTDLFDADLREADLKDADLDGANLYLADLSEADLDGAYLREADLERARGVTDNQLAQAKYLSGATMPDGQILRSYEHPDMPTFEEWRESNGRGEDGGEQRP
jgi:uncharacterized protein YjbI with pentapeptide repeats